MNHNMNLELVGGHSRLQTYFSVEGHGRRIESFLCVMEVVEVALFHSRIRQCPRRSVAGNVAEALPNPDPIEQRLVTTWSGGELGCSENGHGRSDRKLACREAW